MFKRPSVNNGSAEKKLDSPKLQLERRLTDQENVEARTVVTPCERLSGDDGPNKVSGDILKFLSSIFLRMSSMKNKGAADNLPFSSTLVSQENGEEIEFRDPYGVCSEFGNRDIGSYRRLFSIEPGAINPRTMTFVHNPACAFLEHGIPERAEMVVELMRKTISKGAKNDEMAVRNKFGLELSEPLVSFALCCGSWSSPAVS
uniref:DUF547 domain-containing protein n=1 Tax=Salix viminalis TaxID=40686 RepID=A0A6N2MFT7_SALVM